MKSDDDPRFCSNRYRIASQTDSSERETPMTAALRVTGSTGAPMVVDPATTQATVTTVVPLPANAARQAGPAREFLTWAEDHQRARRLHGAELAQITQHHDANPAGDAVHQLQAWAVRHAHEKALHDSAIAQMRHR